MNTFSNVIKGAGGFHDPVYVKHSHRSRQLRYNIDTNLSTLKELKSLICHDLTGNIEPILTVSAERDLVNSCDFSSN